MSNSYVIEWKSKVNGRAGKGNKVFSQEEAGRLAAELNREYPDIQHEPVLVGKPTPAVSGVDAGSSGEPSPSQNEVDEPAPSFSSR